MFTCPVCILSWYKAGEAPRADAEASSVELCSVCRNALDRAALGLGGDSDEVWLRHCSERRADLRRREAAGEMDRYPQHAWWAVHADGQDYDEMIDSAVAHKESDDEGGAS